jgi:hypothetical protein
MVLLFGAVAAAPAAKPSAAPVVYVDVPAGIRIPAKFDERISSQEATTGQSFRFETTMPTEIGDLTIPSGTPGRGSVEFAAARRGEHGGRLEIAVDRLDLRDGRSVAVTLPLESERPVRGAVIVFGGEDLGSENVVLEKGETFVVVTASNASPLPIP